MRRIYSSLAAAVLIFQSNPSVAHAFGQRYDLPAPLWIYLSGAGAAVALSFVIMAIILQSTNRFAVPTLPLSTAPVCRWLAHPLFLGFLQALSVGIFMVVLATGFFGVQNPIRNFAAPMVWVIWWIGLAIVSALLGDLWRIINPWRTLYRWGERLFGHTNVSRTYPALLGYWPAVVLFAIFAWLELISETGESPRQLAYLIVIYSVITLWGMGTYGPETWLKHGEAFTVAFSLFGRFAPMGADRQGRWVLRPPAIALLTQKPVASSLAAFVLLILSTVTYDGFLETPAWGSVLGWIAEDATLRPFFVWLQEAGVNLHKLAKTLGLAVFVLGFVAAFLLFCGFMRQMGGAGSFRNIAGTFVLTLLPIAIAYHLAHYLSYFLVSGQLIIPLISDPFGQGWDLIGTADYKIDIGIVNAKFVWYLSVLSIVLGHLIAVYLAHVTALRVFPTERAALLSQLPMIVLMVGYTMVSLWILSQPVVESSFL